MKRNIFVPTKKTKANIWFESHPRTRAILFWIFMIGHQFVTVFVLELVFRRFF